MAYLRGETYIWSSEHHTHFWAAHGDDGWRESGWGEHHLAAASQHELEPGGVMVRQDAVDAFVIMRFAEILRERRLDEALDAATKLGGTNAGCEALLRHAPQIRAAFPFARRHLRFVQASRERLSAVEHLAGRFFREVVVDHEYEDVLLTDESDLYDFTSFTDPRTQRDAEVTAMLARMTAHYLVDADTAGTTSIVGLLEFLAQRGITD
jgi:hypothetical protein